MNKSRYPNFTTAEIMHLLRLVEKYPIIENKRTDGATTRDKQTAWQNLAAEYNSQTKFCPRTPDNLLSCYKNQKVKAKKQYSNEKMAIKAPLLLNAIEEYGQDWDRVAQATEGSSSDCQTSFKQLVKEAKQEDAAFKKEINRTGGGPLPSCSGDAILTKVKTLIGPSLEGLYTIYDGDADFMKEQQSTSFDKILQPIEMENVPPMENSITSDSTPTQTIDSGENHRLNVMKRKVDPSLESLKKGKKKLNVSHSFQELACDKKDLVKAQKKLVDQQIEHQQLLIELSKEKLEFEKKKNEMELQFLKEKHDLELILLRNKNIDGPYVYKDMSKIVVYRRAFLSFKLIWT